MSIYLRWVAVGWLAVVIVVIFWCNIGAFPLLQLLNACLVLSQCLLIRISLHPPQIDLMHKYRIYYLQVNSYSSQLGRGCASASKLL